MNFVETDKKIVSPRGPTLTIHLGGVYHGKPFCHQMGPDQTLLAETWRTLLQITFRVFFMSGNHENHKNRSRKSRDVLFLKKKAPARQPRVVVRMGFHQKSRISISASSGTRNLKPIIVDFWNASETCECCFHRNSLIYLKGPAAGGEALKITIQSLKQEQFLRLG